MDNNTKIAIRSFTRKKIYYLINIVGLAVGLGCAIFIYLWTADELKFDKFHKKSSSIYRILREEKFSDGSKEIGETTSAKVHELVSDKIPEIKLSSRYAQDIGTLPILSNKDQKILASGAYVDSAFLAIFSFSVLEGTVSGSFNNRNSIIITESLASKLFGANRSLDNIINIEDKDGNRGDYRVTAIIENVPFNSSLHFDFIVPFEDISKRKPWLLKWGSNSIQTFILADEKNADLAIENKLNQLIDSHCSDCSYELFTQPLQDIYLRSDFSNGSRVGTGRIQYVKLFIVIAILIIMLACVNYMNLATALSTTRAKEVGVRKMLGANRKTLIYQFIYESFLTTFVAIALSLAIVYLCMPLFNSMSSKTLELDFTDFKFVLILISMIVFTSLFSGGYPSFVLSAGNPLGILKSKNSSGGSSLRRALVVFQFSTAIILIIGTLVIRSQINFIKNKNLGYKMESLVYFNLNSLTKQKFDAIRNELETFPEFNSISQCDQLPFEINNTSTDASWEGKGENENVSFRVLQVDADFITMSGISLVAGRPFENLSFDHTNYIINERAAKATNLKDPIGQTFRFWNGEGKIVGVVKDFHHSSMYTPIEPLVIVLAPEKSNYGIVSIKGGSEEEAINTLQNIVSKHSGSALEYGFFDQKYEASFKNEITIGKLSNTFSGIAIVIASLGLLGLSAHAAQKKYKEIGIRKTLGASVPNITTMLVLDSMKSVFVSILIGIPISYLIVEKWLENYAYHTSIDVFIFVIAVILIVTIAVATVSVHALRAALVDPVKSLKIE